ncbi:MAG: MFS transporter, partial [Bacillota bacterium]
MAKPIHPRPILLLSFGHLVADFYQGAVPALLPLWKQAFGLQYAATGAMMLALQVSSSVVQPIFGVLGDRFRNRYLLPLAVLLAGTGIAGAVLAGSYGAAIAGITLGGLGVALYHPEASRRAHEKSGALRATAMSWFSVGGNVGLGLGPLVVAGLMGWGARALALGLAGIAWVAALALVAGRSMFIWSGPESSATGGGQGDRRAEAGMETRVPRRADRWGALLLLATIVVMRSWTHAGVQAFVPLRLTDSGVSVARAQALLALFLLAGAAGTLVGGPMADVVGRKPVIVASMALAAPLMWLVGHVSSAWVPAALAALGFVLVSTFSVSVVLAQELLPGRVGTASGIVLGASVGTG